MYIITIKIKVLKIMPLNFNINVHPICKALKELILYCKQI